MIKYGLLPLFFFFRTTEDLPYMKCPLHTVLKLTPVAYGKSLPENVTVTLYGNIRREFKYIPSFIL